jgi:hypothetical protein
MGLAALCRRRAATGASKHGPRDSLRQVASDLDVQLAPGKAGIADALAGPLPQRGPLAGRNALP